MIFTDWTDSGTSAEPDSTFVRFLTIRESLGFSLLRSVTDPRFFSLGARADLGVYRVLRRRRLSRGVLLARIKRQNFAIYST
jgi:hypothetical protein